jgi:uncharacterized lipoprotein YmbA
MNMKRHAFHVFVAGLAHLLTACVSPRATLYTLEPVDAAPSTNAPRPIILLTPFSLPSVVDRPLITLRDDDYTVSASEQQRWATPLKESLPRLLTSAMTARSLSVRYVLPGEAPGQTPRARLGINITRLDLAPRSGATLVAHWLYRDSDGVSVLEGDAASHETLVKSGYPGYVDALRRASIALSKDIADQIGRVVP